MTKKFDELAYQLGQVLVQLTAETVLQADDNLPAETLERATALLQAGSVPTAHVQWNAEDVLVVFTIGTGPDRIVLAQLPYANPAAGSTGTQH